MSRRRVVLRRDGRIYLWWNPPRIIGLVLASWMLSTATGGSGWGIFVGLLLVTWAVES